MGRSEKNSTASIGHKLLKIGQTIIIKYNAPLFLIILIIVSAIISPAFRTSRNIFNILIQNVPYMLIAMGVMLTIMSAGIDLSVAAVAGCGNVLVSIVISRYGQTNSVWLLIGIVCVLALGCAIGCLNGLLIGKLRMPPFITTLAMMSAGQGLAFLMTNGAQITLKNEMAAPGALNRFAAYRDPLIGMPIPVYCTAIIILIFWFIMKYTSFGRLVLAIGSNEAAVRLAGIDVTKYKVSVYTISGGLAGLTGVFLAGRTALGAPAVSQDDYALTAVAACVIGGVALEGGKGTVLFTVVGVLIFALITNIMNLLSLSKYTQYIAKGAIIVLAILLSRIGQKNQ